MSKVMKRVMAFMLAVLMVFSVNLAVPELAVTASASSSVYWNPYNTYVYSYKPADVSGIQYYAALSISGCTKKSQIKNLKSSNKSVAKVEAEDGYVRVIFKKKAGTTMISCKVNGVKLKHKFTVKKYTNVFSSIKVGSTSYTSKYAKTNYAYTSKSIKSKTLKVKVKKGWKIVNAYVYNGNTTKSYTSINSRTFSKKITLNKSYAYVVLGVYQASTGRSEYMYLRKN